MNYPSEFTAAMQKLLANEGGYSNWPGDRGGETKYGISKRSYPHLDIANLTQDQAAELYFRDWWTKYNFDHLAPSVAGKVFNLAVNMGAHSAVYCLQRACRACGQPIKEDGLVGVLLEDITHTLSIADGGRTLLAALRSEAAGYYRLIAAGRDDNADLKGWLNRAYE